MRKGIFTLFLVAGISFGLDTYYFTKEAGHILKKAGCNYSPVEGGLYYVCKEGNGTEFRGFNRKATEELFVECRDKTFGIAPYFVIGRLY